MYMFGVILFKHTGMMVLKILLVKVPDRVQGFSVRGAYLPARELCTFHTVRDVKDLALDVT